jgi:hypothetical protein
VKELLNAYHPDILEDLRLKVGRKIPMPRLMKAEKLAPHRIAEPGRKHLQQLTHTSKMYKTTNKSSIR